MHILVHVCCGPCAIVPMSRLMDEGHAVTALFYNPNIHPLTEYLRRRDGLADVAERLKFPVIWLDEEYDPAVYLRRVAFKEAERCLHCYALRLERTLAAARTGGFGAFTSTLLYSRFQKHDQIAAQARELSGDGTPAFLYRDFRTGWDEGVRTSRDWGIYRQPYCGCVYSEAERYRGRLSRAHGAGR